MKISTTISIFDLKTRIAREFATTLHPINPDQINPYPCCAEHDAMTEWFQRHTWEDFQMELEKGTLDPGFMPHEPEGFKYFLPSVLLYTLESCEAQKEEIWDWKTIAGISCPPISYWVAVLIPIFMDISSIADLQEKRKTFTHAQIKIIQDYLSLFIDLSPEENFKKDAQKALQEIWK